MIDGIKNLFSLESKIPFDAAKIRLPDTVRFLLVQQNYKLVKNRTLAKLTNWNPLGIDLIMLLGIQIKEIPLFR